MSIWTWMFCPHYMKQLHFSSSHVSNVYIAELSLVLHFDISPHCEICHLSLCYLLFSDTWFYDLLFPMELKVLQKQNLWYLHSYSSLSCSAAHLWKPYSMLWWNLGEISEWERLKLSVTYCDPPPSQDVLWLQKIPYVHIKTSFLITFCRRHRGSCPHR